MVNFPFIVKMIGSNFDEENFYFFLEYIKGSPFNDVIYELDLLTLDQVRFYSACVVLMLHYLHERSIIYRDLKPENLICNEQGYLRLIDLGTAKYLNCNSDGTEETLERTFTLIGTPQYMAPEVIKQTGYSYSYDYWSLGIPGLIRHPNLRAAVRIRAFRV
jgi:cGMP-dependent protein kinase